MKVRSWSKPHIFQSTLRMLSADHLNIDGSPFPVKCVRKLRSALGGDVMYRCVCVYTYNVRKADFVHVLYNRISNQEQTHSMSAVGFGFSFELVIHVKPGIDPKMMRVANVHPSSKV